MKVVGAVRLGAAAGGCLVALLFALLLGALGGWLTVVAVASLGLTLCEVVLHRVVASAFPRQLDAVLGELYARIALEQGLLLVYVVRVQQLGSAARAVVVVAVVVYQALRATHTVVRLTSTRLEARRPQVRNLVDPHGPWPSLSPLVGPRGVRLLVGSAGLPALGLLWAAVSGSFALVAPAAVVMVVIAAAVVVVCVPGALSLLRRPPRSALVAAVHDAVLRHRPEVVLLLERHCARPPLGDTLARHPGFARHARSAGVGHRS